MTKFLLKLIPLISVIVTLNACGVKTVHTVKNNPVKTKDKQTSYYDKFIFKVLNNCKNPSTLRFKSTYSWEPAIIGSDLDGRPLFATLSLQLFEDGTYWAEYSEHVVKQVSVGSTEYKVLYKNEELQGAWRVINDRIEVDGLGYGLPAEYTHSDRKQSDSFRFTLTTAIHDPRAVNSKMNITTSISNTGPKGISINQYCNINE